MSIVVYKCDVCKRDIELERNLKGLENIQRCTITHGCRGKLYQIQVLTDYVRGRLPDQVAGLDDWRQRKVLYNHEQAIERDNWIIKHNLGTFPSVSVYANVPTEDDPDNQEEVIPIDTVIVDEDNLILRFDRGLSGLAQLVARQSDPNLLRPFVGLNIETEVLQQLSFNADIAIATRISTVGEPTSVDLGVEYITTQNTIVPTTYTAEDNQIDSYSPWRDVDKVIIKGKTYTVRSFHGLIPEMDDETVASGSVFTFNSITTDNVGSPVNTTRTIAQDEVYILIANEPFDPVDKITSQYIDVFDITAASNNFTFVYDSGEFFADKEIIQETYPPIRSV